MDVEKGISRPNHQARCKKKGVLKIWMEPETSKTWDILNVHKHIKDIRSEGDHRRRKRERRRNRSRSRSRRRRNYSRDRKRSPDGRGSLKKERHSPKRWSHDKYLQMSKSDSKSTKKGRDNDRSRTPSKNRIKGEVASSHEKRKDDKKSSNRENLRSRRSLYSESKSRHDSTDKKSDEHDKERRNENPSRSEYRESNHSSKKDDRNINERDRRRSEEQHSSSSKKRKKDKENSINYDVNLYEAPQPGHSSSIEESIRRSPESHKKSKKPRRLTGSDHEEVNEIQDDFEIDSVGKVENSEETLQKMKCAIIGILDEEISTLSRKIKK